MAERNLQPHAGLDPDAALALLESINPALAALIPDQELAGSGDNDTQASGSGQKARPTPDEQAIEKRVAELVGVLAQLDGFFLSRLEAARRSSRLAEYDRAIEEVKEELEEKEALLTKTNRQVGEWIADLAARRADIDRAMVHKFDDAPSERQTQS